MQNPLEDIENRKAMTDLGLMAIRVYQGSLVESTSRVEAFWATAAYFTGLFRGSLDNDDERG